MKMPLSFKASDDSVIQLSCWFSLWVCI